MLQTSEILSYISEQEAIELKKLEKALKLTKKLDRTKLEIAIKALTKLDIVKSDNEGRICLNNKESFVKAKIRCSSKGYCFAIREGEEEDIYIREHHLNHAWHDDVVLLKLHKEAQRRRSPEGIVVCILERNTRNLIAFIKDSDKKLIADPLDDRITSNIILEDIDRRYLNKEDGEQPVEVKINKYPIAQYKAEGEVVRSLPLDQGQKGDLEILLTKSNLQLDTKSPKSSFKDLSKTKRTDLTSQPALLLSSWDNSNAPILPAIHIEHIEIGTRVWIHTPAIAERFNFGSKLDEWLSKRGSTICLGDDWRQLLNKELIEESNFNVGLVKEAVSISYDLNKEGKIIHWQFALTNINPVASVNKEQMEAIATRKPKARSIPLILKPIKDHIGQLKSLIYCAELISNNTTNSNSINIEYRAPSLKNLSEFKVDYPSNYFKGWNLPLDISDTNSLLRTLTSIANRIWYFHSNQFNIDTYALKQVPIENSAVNEIIKSALAFGVKLELDDNGYVNPNNIVESISDLSNKRIFNKILKQSTNRQIPFISSQKNADRSLLVSKDFNPSTPFSSPWCFPNLNYLDILNQYLIVLLLREGKSKPKSRTTIFANLAESDSWKDLDWDIFTNTTNTTLKSLVNKTSLNYIEKNITKSHYFTENLISMSKSREALKLIGKVHDAYITGVQSYGFFVEIQPLMIEGLVHVSTLNDDWYEYRSRQTLLIGRKNKRTYQLGNVVSVKILKVDLLRNQIDLEVVNKPLKQTSSPDNDELTDKLSETSSS